MEEAVKPMKEFIQAVCLLLLLDILVIANMPDFFAVLAGSSLLLILFAVRSLLDEQGALLCMGQLLLSAIICIFSGEYLTCLLFTEYRGGKRQWIRFCLPTVFFLIFSFLAHLFANMRNYMLANIDMQSYTLANADMQNYALADMRSYIFPDMPAYLQAYLGQSTAEKILHLLILTALSGILYALEKMAGRYITVREQTARAVTVSAVNEMYEKKLNQELAFKNYLADKNARFQERETISRNIHNSVGHSITAAVMTLDAADMLFESNPTAAREKMNIAADRIRESLTSIRRAVRVLDTENEWISWEDFTGSLTEISERFTLDFTTTGTQVRIHNDFFSQYPAASSETLTQILRQQPRMAEVLTQSHNKYEGQMLPREHTEFLSGAFKELLTNGVKHGNADSFIVHLTADSAHVKLSVLDNGKSDFDESNMQERLERGFGLKKLVSYAKHCGGTASFSNENGFLAEISLPLHQLERDSIEK